MKRDVFEQGLTFDGSQIPICALNLPESNFKHTKSN